MKTAEEMARDAWAELDSGDDYNYCPGSLNHETTPKLLEKLLRKYGAQVREEAAKIAEPYESGSYCRVCGPDIADTIRKMELP